MYALKRNPVGRTPHTEKDRIILQQRTRIPETKKSKITFQYSLMINNDDREEVPLQLF